MATSKNQEALLAPDLQRRKQLAEAFMAQGMQAPQPQMVSGHYVAPSWTQHLNQALQGFIGNRIMRGVSKDQETAQAERQQRVAALMNAMMGQGGAMPEAPGSQGAAAPPAPDMSAQPQAGAPISFPVGASGVPQPQPQPQPQAAPAPQPQMDPRQAAAMALASGYPELEKVAETMLTGGFQSLAPGQVVVDKLGNVQNFSTPDGGTPYDTVVIGGDLYQQTSTGLKKLDNAPKVTANVRVNTPISMGQKAGAEAFFRHAAEQVQELGQRASAAGKLAQTVANMEALDQEGIFSNQLTGPVTYIANLAQGLGMEVDTTKLGNTETFEALSTEVWQNLISQMGGNRGVTAEEAAQIKRMVPLAAHSPEARAQLYSIVRNNAARQVQQYQNANDAFAKAALQEDPTIASRGFGDVYLPQPQDTAPAPGIGAQPPAPPAGLPQSPIPLDEYLRNIKGRN